MKKIIIRFFYSCDFIKGFILNPEDFLLSSHIKLFQTVGRLLAKINKKKRLKVIHTANHASSKPLIVSIVLPVFNSEDTIQAAIKSIQDQSYPHWELLIVDDGSTDNTRENIDEFARKDSRIKLVKNEDNKGVAYARNVGLYYAKGDYITFHDADDLSHPERFEYQLAAFLSKPDLTVVIFQYVRVNQNKEPYLINGKVRWNRVSGMMIKHRLIDEIGFFKPLHISEDSEYYERILATFGKKSRKNICKVLYYALFSPDSLLFSNANVDIKGKSVNYKIHAAEFAVLQEFRNEHKRILSGELSPYQSFSIDKEIHLHE